MSGDTFVKPDLTLTIDVDGVIRHAEGSDDFADEALSQWRGRSWTETFDAPATSEIQNLINTMRSSGGSSCFRVQQRLPSGKELPFEYTTFSLGEDGGFLAVGRNLQTIADLQSRLVATQRDRERDYWKFRDIETRYKMLLDASAEATVVVRASNMRIVEVNVAATRSLSLLPGPEFFPDLAPRERRTLDSMLDKAREHGRAPSIAIRLPTMMEPWSVRASMIPTEDESFYLIQMAPLGASAPALEQPEEQLIERLLRRLPDGFAIIDASGVIVKANNTFLDLIQIGTESAAIGQSSKQWLSHPGADVSVLLDLLQRHGNVRMMSTVIYGQLGSNTSVEISAVGDVAGTPGMVALIVRDTTPRAGGAGKLFPFDTVETLDVLPKNFSLEAAVRHMTEDAEQKAIIAVLRICKGNRTAAAKRLGLSRQTLHAKLNKYGLEAG